MRPTNVFEVKVPDSDPDAGSVTVLEWHVHEGESIVEGQPLLDLVASTGFTTLSAPSPGRVTEILVDEGTPVDRGQTLALIMQTRG